MIIYLYHIDRQRSLACDGKHEIVRASCDLRDSCFVFLCYIIFLPKQHFLFLVRRSVRELHGLDMVWRAVIYHEWCHKISHIAVHIYEIEITK